jgi:hypothetical protein
MPFMFDRALLEDDDFISAWNVVCGELNGHRYDWNTGEWSLRKL